MSRSEKRKYKRLDIELDLSCRNVSSTAEKSHTGQTVNVSPGGLYFETAEGVFEPGNVLKVELSIPPAAGLLEFGGRISGFARVLRADNIGTIADSVSGRYGVAVEFCRSLKLCT
jgi:hypothetical protein